MGWYKSMCDMKQNGHNSKRLSPLWGRDDGAFANDMNSFYSRFDKHDCRSVIDDAISSTKTGGNLHIEVKMDASQRSHDCVRLNRSARE